MRVPPCSFLPSLFCLLFTFFLAPPPPARAATLDVTSTADTRADDGVCTLREAILAANLDRVSGSMPGECPAGDGGVEDLILLPAGTYLLALTGDDDEGELGDLDIAGDLRIVGAGAPSTVVDGDQIDRVFDVQSGDHDVRLVDLTVRGGRASDGPSSGDTGGHGGGLRIRDGAEVTLERVVVTGNRSGDGADGQDFPGAGGRGGGLYAEEATLILIECEVSQNVTGDGGESPDFGGQGGDGGGIAASGVFGPALLSIHRSSITGNVTGAGGLSPDVDGAGGDGGGLWTRSVPVVIEESLLAANRTGPGGGSGPGGSGGGSYLDERRVQLVNSTVSGNETADGGSGGGVLVNDFPEAVEMSIQSTTIADNRAPGGSGGGLYSLAGDRESRVSFENSIIAGNQSQAMAADDCDAIGILTAAGFDLVGAGTGCPAGPNQVQVDSEDVFTKVLEPLGANGGPTDTHALRPASPAIDAGSCPTLETDQRGFPRPAGAGCDIGAFESGADDPIFNDDFETGDTSAWSASFP